MLFRSKALDTDDKFSFTFTTPGTFPYFCCLASAHDRDDRGRGGAGRNTPVTAQDRAVSDRWRAARMRATAARRSASSGSRCRISTTSTRWRAISLRNASDADDAVQECYLRAFRHFDTFRGGPIKPWLLAILRNVCHAAYAGNGRAGATRRRRGEPSAARTDVARRRSTRRSRRCCGGTTRETMRRLIGELPAEFREVIVLREINDLSYRDIADRDRGADRHGDVAAGARAGHAARGLDRGRRRE